MTYHKNRRPRIIDETAFGLVLEAKQLEAQLLSEEESAEAAWQAWREDQERTDALHRLYRPLFQQAVLRSEPPQGWDA